VSTRGRLAAALILFGLLLSFPAGLRGEGEGEEAPGASGRPPGEAAPAPARRSPGAGGAATFTVGLAVYAGSRSAVCLGESFLELAAERAGVAVEPRLRTVRLREAEEVFACPVLVFSGMGSFRLVHKERASLAAYLVRGGFVIASAGCGDAAWDRSFRAEVAVLGGKLRPLPDAHPFFRAVLEIAEVRVKEGKPRPLEGLFVDGRLVLVYSSQGLNDTLNASGCCCCGGNEVLNAAEICANALVWSLRN